MGYVMAEVLAARTVLAVRDLAASTQFYIGVLGFARDFGDGSDGWSFLSRGGFRVMLGECPTDRAASELGNHSYVAYLLVDHVDQLYDEFVRRGALVTSARHPNLGVFENSGFELPMGIGFSSARPSRQPASKR